MEFQQPRLVTDPARLKLSPWSLQLCREGANDVVQSSDNLEDLPLHTIGCFPPQRLHLAHALIFLDESMAGLGPFVVHGAVNKRAAEPRREHEVFSELGLFLERPVMALLAWRSDRERVQPCCIGNCR
jgi:hypothetical protein